MGNISHTLFGILFFSAAFVCIQCLEKVGEKNDDPTWAVPLEEFESIVRTGDAVVVDVREPDEVYEVRVDAKKYINVPLKQIESSLKMSDAEFETTYKAPKPGVEDDVIYICRSGRRSEYALDSARTLNYMRTRHFAGGTLGWIENFPDMVVRQQELEMAEKADGKEEL